MSNVNLGTITPANANSASILGTLTYSCTNSGTTAGYVSVCLAVDGGEYTAATFPPRYMQKTGTVTPLAFTMTLPNNEIWGTRSSGIGFEYQIPTFEIAKRPGGSNTQTTTGPKSVSINISLLPNYNNTLATVGTYSNNFGNGNHTALTVSTDTNQSAANCTTGNQGIDRFPFTVTATVIPDCTITATSDVNLGARSASDTNITGGNSSAITVQCTNGGSYYIGLQPSNNSQDGAGVMSGTGGNLDKVPYQLRSTAGMNGEIWGNTATSTTKGNGVADFGTGSPKAQTVYVTVPRADFKPDSYSDTVTIKVSY